MDMRVCNGYSGSVKDILESVLDILGCNGYSGSVMDIVGLKWIWVCNG